jgi:hypothetical protein
MEGISIFCSMLHQPIVRIGLEQSHFRFIFQSKPSPSFTNKILERRKEVAKE